MARDVEMSSFERAWKDEEVKRFGSFLSVRVNECISTGRMASKSLVAERRNVKEDSLLSLDTGISSL